MKRVLISTIFCISIAAFVMFISGCASGKTRKAKEGAGLIYASSSKIPAWVTEIPEEKEYYYFVGTSGDEESFDSGKKAALNDAISQVVGVIGVTVSSSSTYEERYFAEQYTTTISAELFTEGRAKVQDAELKEIYYEEHRNPDGSTFFRAWVLVKYSKREIEKEQERLSEIIALKYGEVKNLEEKALSFQENQALGDAVIAHLSASVAALDLEDGEIFFSRNMTRASELLMQFRLKKIGEDQIGYIGNPLKSPLILNVYYLEGGREIPIPNVPVRFSYKIPKKDSAGYKYQVANAVTDSKGLASFTVEMVYEVSDKNTVDARIDLSPHIKALKSAPPALQDQIKTFRDIQQQKKVTFVFRSDTLARQIKTGVFFMQIDQDDTLLPKPVTAPAAYEILYEKRFSIKVIEINPGTLFDKPERVIIEKLIESAGRGVERVLFGYVQIIEYDMISGFHTARAKASALLVDVNTGNTIKTWQIFKSATGSSRELVKINVLYEAGKSLGEIVSNTMP